MPIDNIKFVEISDRLDNLFNKIINDFKQAGEDNKSFKERIISDYNKHKNSKLVKITFVGQYSAGKSTIISALTNRNDIKIDADIATDMKSEYAWNNILLVDTPGLYTEHKDHDQITYDALKESDLIAFVITSDLFDDLIIQNFIKLAYEKNYKSKMFLIINKMSSENGGFEKLKKNYIESLNRSLENYCLNGIESDFNICFIDAEDYKEGLRDNDEKFILLSNFNQFVIYLNKFIEKNGIVGKLDQPIRNLIFEIENVIINSDNNVENKSLLSLLARAEKRVNNNLLEAVTECKIISAEIRKFIVDKGYELIAQFENDSVNFETNIKNIESLIDKHCLVKSNELEVLLTQKREIITEEIKKVFDTEMGKFYLDSISRHSISIEKSSFNVDDSIMKNFKTLVKTLNYISDTIIKNSVNFKNCSGLLKSTNVSGSNAHNIVLSVGKFFGTKFKPWQAVNIAKFGSQVMRVVGGIAQILSALIQVKEIYDDHQRPQEIMKAKNQCMTEFVTIAKEVELQINKQFDLYKKHFYIPIFDKISELKQDHINNMKNLSDFNKTLIKYKEELNSLICEIYEGV